MKKNKKIAILSFIVIIGISIIYIIISHHRIEKSHKYTLGYVSKIHSTRHGQAIKYYFFVQERKYTGSYSGGDFKSVEIGNCYLIKYEPENPKNNRILIHKLVPDSVVESPTRHWDIIPF